MSTQANSDHPLTRFGYRQPPHWLWRLSRRGNRREHGIEDFVGRDGARFVAWYQ